MSEISSSAVAASETLLLEATLLLLVRFGFIFSVSSVSLAIQYFPQTDCLDIITEKKKTSSVFPIILSIYIYIIVVKKKTLVIFIKMVLRCYARLSHLSCKVLRRRSIRLAR